MSDGEVVDRAKVDESSKKRRLQYGVRALMLAPLVMIVFVGLACFVDIYTSLLSYWLFGFGWERDVWNWLIGVGIPVSFVTGYVSFALLRLPGWLVLAVATFALGLRRSRRSHFLAWLFALSFPLSELIASSWFDSSGHSFSDSSLLTSFHVRIVSAFGFAVGISAWFLGWWMRGRNYDDAAERRVTSFGRTVQIAIWTLVLIGSGYGWFGLVSLR